MIIVTRPMPEAQEYAKELEAGGFEVLCTPMLELRAVDFEVPDMDEHEGVLFTSAQGVRFFAARCGARGAAYCVGPHTEAAARYLGFSPVYSADGGGLDLSDYIVKASRSENFTKPFLHVRGRDVARKTDEDLKAQGIACDQLVVYAADFVDGISKECEDAIKGGQVKAVTFLSKRTAENFIRLAVKAGLEDSLKGIKALCISQGVISYVRPEIWASTYSAETPDRKGMRALLDQI